MNRLLFIIRQVLIGLMLIYLFNGCAVYNEIFGKPPEEKTPEELLGEGLSKLEKGRYDAATEDFQAIMDRYPYSRHAITAELKIADAYYKIEDYGVAFDAYDEFEKLHPRDKNVPYVIYQKGMCHFSQVKSIDRDQSNTLKAREEFERLVKRFPKDKYAKSARVKLRKCLIYLAEYELYVGHFYFKMEKYRPAMERYMYLIKNYPDMGQYHEALEYIGKCKEKLAEEEMEAKE